MRLINEQKLKSWNEFVTESTKDNPWGIIYRISRNKLNIEKVNELVTENGELITESKQIAELLTTKLFPGDQPHNE
jgi:hypothetical protein